MTFSYAYQLSDIKFFYDNAFTLQVDNLQIKPGTILGITGPNGSGKTTLLKILSFLLMPYFGQIKYFDEIVNPKKLFFMRRQTTLLLQETILLNRTIFENIIYGLKVRGDYLELAARVAKALEMVGLDMDFLAKNTQQLSGGEARRVALASRIILSPKILLLDEPFAHIDKQSKQLIFRVLVNLAATCHTTIIFSSHNLAEINGITDNILELRRGNIL